MSKFQVGDIVVGNKLATEYYSITKEGVILEVTEAYDEHFRGRPVLHKSGRGYFGLDYNAFYLKESIIQENE